MRVELGDDIVAKLCLCCYLVHFLDDDVVDVVVVVGSVVVNQ